MIDTEALQDCGYPKVTLVIHYYNGFTYRYRGGAWRRVGAWKTGHIADIPVPHTASPLMQTLLNKYVNKLLGR